MIKEPSNVLTKIEKLLEFMEQHCPAEKPTCPPRGEDFAMIRYGRLYVLWELGQLLKEEGQ